MKAFSELTSASQVNNADLLAISQENSGSYASKKTTVKDVTDKANLNLAEEYDSTSTYAVDDYCIYESVLYKCTASTTGSFDSTKWTQVVVTDEMGSGGGSSTLAGLTDTNIVSPSGNQILKFNSTNNKWENAADTGGGEYYSYSTTEQAVGEWIDGKTIYKKTYSGLSVSIPQTTSSASWVNTNISLGNIDTLIKGEAVDESKQCYTVNFAKMNNNTNIGVIVPSCPSSRVVTTLTIFYTKSL